MERTLKNKMNFIVRNKLVASYNSILSEEDSLLVDIINRGLVVMMMAWNIMNYNEI